MNKDTLKLYANLITAYCLAIKPGDKVLVRTSTLAEPFLKELHPILVKAGAAPEYQLSFDSKEKGFFENASDTQLDQVSLFYEYAVNTFDAVLTILAPHDLYETKTIDPEKKKRHQSATAKIRKTFMTRAAAKELKWALCVYPTESAAQAANMSLENYTKFVTSACFLDTPNAIQAWQSLSKDQERITHYLNTCKQIQYIGPKTNITFSTEERIWINSDGKRNMPSGEVFTSPVENSVNGSVYFDIPTVYDGEDVEGVTLTVKDGYVESWTAEVGQAVLDRIFQIPGSRYFGEVAIGTNKKIQTPTKNILFDEKIGGTIHMAIGASYPETGGRNESAVHWDMISTMTQGHILADDKVIYEKGNFLI